MKRLLLIPPRLILPLMIFMGVLIIGARAGDVFSTLESGKIFDAVQTARAEEKKPDPAPEPETKPATAQPAAPENHKPEEKKPENTAAAEKKPEPAASAADIGSPEGDLFRQLQGRREQLDKREEQLDSRDAMLKIAEQRVDNKMKGLEKLRAQLQQLLGQASAAQQQQIENLVKIYETMKPKDAAKIFETLELPTLLGVVQRMKPVRTSAIMAEMNPEKAKEITVALTKQDQLPKLEKGESGN